MTTNIHNNHQSEKPNALETRLVYMIILLIPLILFMLTPRAMAGDAVAAWKADLRRQIVAERPRIEARYSNADRNAFEIDAEKYQLGIDLAAESGRRVRSLKVVGAKGAVEVIRGRGIYLQLTDSTGRIYSSLNCARPSRVNIYRRGPYYIETHWLDIELADSDGTSAPVKGEVVFYSYPEKAHIGAIFHVTGPIEVKSAGVVCEFSGETCASMAETNQQPGTLLSDVCLVRRADDAPTCALIYPVPNGADNVVLEKTDFGVRIFNYIYSDEAHEGATVKWAEGVKPAAYFELFPLEKGRVTPEMEAEVSPLLSTNFEATAGRSLGYDPVRGCYKLRTDSPGGFSYHYQHPNDYEAAAFSVKNSSIPRKIYVLHETRANAGLVECGVLLDSDDNTLPVTVQISKNFKGEFEEPFYNPEDTEFSETIFPLHLEENEKRGLTSLHLYQNWGSHPLKQFSSLGAWMDYYHMSTGVTETTCYVPFLFAGPEGVNIADMRPMSQKFWESQPQHDNVAGHSFLRYQDDTGKWHFLEYSSTTFHSTGPNWANVSLNYVSDDGKAKVTIDTFEMPQTDETRNFVHLRIEFLDTIKVKDGDFARNMRLLSIASWVQGMQYTTVAYGGPTGEPTVTSIKLNDDFTIAGAPIPRENAFATIYPDQKGANAFIVRRFEGKLGGEDAAPGVSVIGWNTKGPMRNPGDTILMLTPVTKGSDINAGDYLDIDLILMPYGGGTQDYKPAQTAAMDYGLNAQKVTNVAAGEKLADFPTRIALDKSGRAEFTLTGGMNYTPVIVEGAKDYRYLRLFSLDNDRKDLIWLSRPGEKDGYQTFSKDDGTFGFVFLVVADGKEHRYLAE
ncbi:MAG: hypothetical protein M1133_14470 [Armatimonadetes bacterium]|nr:hypothetical protein [Armatimonadota bacterium]